MCLLDDFSFSLPSRLSVCLCSRFSHVRLCAALRTVARQAPLSMGFSGVGCWAGHWSAGILEWGAGRALLQGVFPTQGSNPGLLLCRQSFSAEPGRKPHK